MTTVKNRSHSIGRCARAEQAQGVLESVFALADAATLHQMRLSQFLKREHEQMKPLVVAAADKMLEDVQRNFPEFAISTFALGELVSVFADKMFVLDLATHELNKELGDKADTQRLAELQRALTPYMQFNKTLAEDLNFAELHYDFPRGTHVPDPLPVSENLLETV
jgi:hypothetical protein